jgi:hypothetical protein
MKIRTDFVTNSSSSSFIIVFNSVAERNRQLQNFSSKYPSFAPTVINDISNHKASRRDILRHIEADLESEAYWKYYWNNRKYWDWNRESPRIDPYKDPEIQKAVKEYVKAGLEKVLQELPKRGYYAIVEYGDDDGAWYGELEHEIMPCQDFVVRRISHH